ncbi:MAG: hypothetical protein JW976_00590 [Syntrophaceae bacterium]|nr:hypothetical protein [Syntrophaceae bacterium]
MGEKSSQNLNNIDQIKNIIFGDNIKIYDRKFSELDKTLNKMTSEFTERFDSIDKRIMDLENLVQNENKKLTESLKQTKSNLEKTLETARRKIENEIKELREDKADKTILANQLIELAMTLKGEDLLQELNSGNKKFDVE